jgi:hypothetical protein
MMNSHDILQKIAEHISDRQTFYSFAICSKKTSEICQMMEYSKREEFDIVECNIVEENGTLYCDWDGKYTKGDLTTSTDPSDWRCVWFKSNGAKCIAGRGCDVQSFVDDIDNEEQQLDMVCITMGDFKLHRLIDELESKYAEPVLCNYTNSSDPLIKLYCDQYNCDIMDQIGNEELLVNYYDGDSSDNDGENEDNSSTQSLDSEDIDSDLDSDNVRPAGSTIEYIWVVNDKKGIITELKDVLYQLNQFGSDLIV